MDDMERTTLEFSLSFVHEYVDNSSQNSQCRTWLKKAVSIIQSANLDAEPMILSELEAVDAYLSGKAVKTTSVDVRTKLDTVLLLCH